VPDRQGDAVSSDVARIVLQQQTLLVPQSLASYIDNLQSKNIVRLIAA
jgi:hypothetical protein